MSNNFDEFKVETEQENNYMIFAVLPDGENTAIACRTGKAISTNNVTDSLKAILCTTYANLRANGYVEEADYIKKNKGRYHGWYLLERCKFRCTNY